ncbi:hypothetical protein IEQ34_005766 [Dendrobium chrysotoxum]|uniref:Late embryogenesis abundant protein LEA-2 subgroup domain-containing protein n=1 Tax=Dendrobium chrysotoxum TaxID=161865 RepID=A0AAV7HDY9_DENCH|nr:hypothetical protein IEQ34_005766 [Dendrobium chrysotoxum]
MAPKLILRRGDRTNPLIWALAILCAGFAVAVILTGIVVFAIYLVYQPKSPYVWVSAAHLDLLDYDQMGLLSIQLSLALVAVNPNMRAHATFSELELALRFEDGDIELALLRAEDFSVEKNGSAALNYVVRSEAVPLDEIGRETLDASLKAGIISFRLQGQLRTRWRVGVFASIKLWTHLSCALRFGVLNGNAVGFRCSSKSH